MSKLEKIKTAALAWLDGLPTRRDICLALALVAVAAWLLY